MRPMCIQFRNAKQLRNSTHGELICFERNAGFCRSLEELDDPRVRIIHDDAVHSDRYVEEADCVISGLPLTL